MKARRSYPDRLTPSSLRLRRAYMRSESVKTGENIEEWVVSYLKRNRIRYSVGDPLSEESYEEFLVIDFPSRWREKFFVLMGNRHFPYFEFH